MRAPHFGTAPAAQRDTGLCLPNRWHHPQPVPPQPGLVTEEYLLPSGWSVTARSGDLRPGPSEGPWGGLFAECQLQGQTLLQAALG